jgi:HEAT repeat protein
VYPNPVPDLFSAQPLILFARYDGAGESVVTLRGKIDGEPYEERVRINLPGWNPDNDSLVSVWAREKIKYLMLEQLGGRVASIEEEVTNLALEYNLMSQYTSFVAVDEVLPEGSDTTLPKTIAIPVPMPEGVSFTGVFGPPSRYPGDFVGEAEYSIGTDMKEVGRVFSNRSQFGRHMRGRYGMMSSAKVPVLMGTPAPARSPRKALALLSPEDAEGGEVLLRFDFSADERLNKYLQEGYQGLAKKDRDLYNALNLNQIYYGGQVDGKKANQALTKLLSSKEEADVAVGLNVMAVLAWQKVEIDEALVAEAKRLATEGKNGHIRSQALAALSALMQPVPLEVLKKTAKDKDATVRILTAHALADKKLGKEAEPLITLLVGDKDQRVAALAIKAGTEARKMNGLISALGNILLNADSTSEYLAVLEAGLGLGRLADASPADKPKIQRLFVKSLKKDYPASVGEEKVNLKRAVSIITLKTLAGYKGKKAYPQILKHACDADKTVQTLATTILAGYEKAAPYLLSDVLSKEQFLDRPELLATVVQHLRDYKPGDDFYVVARRILEKKEVAAKSHAILRVALVEALFDRGNADDVTRLTSLLRKDSSWKVRRAILAKLASLQKEKVFDTAIKALDDPHPVIRQLALTEAVAATAGKDNRAAYLDKISANPAPATCDEILVGEGFGADLSLRPREKLQKILNARAAK